jgi:hypothetical protein
MFSLYLLDENRKLVLRLDNIIRERILDMEGNDINDD